MNDRQLLLRFQAISAKFSVLEKRIKVLETRIGGVAEKVVFFVTIDGQKRKVDQMFLKVTQMLPISVAFTDAAGNAAIVDGVPQWAVTSPDLGDIKASEDGLSAVFVPKGPVGKCVVQVKADADLSGGVKELVGELTIELIGGDAVSAIITPGEPTEKAA